MVGNYDPRSGALNPNTGLVTDANVLADLEDMRNLRKGGTLTPRSTWIRFEVEIWAGARFQPIGRTVRGLMRYEDANRLLASIGCYGDKPNDGESWEQMRDRIMYERFQHLLAFQVWQGIFNNNDELTQHYRMFFRMYPDLELAYVWSEGGVAYSVW